MTLIATLRAILAEKWFSMFTHFLFFISETHNIVTLTVAFVVWSVNFQLYFSSNTFFIILYDVILYDYHQLCVFYTIIIIYRLYAERSAVQGVCTDAGNTKQEFERVRWISEKRSRRKDATRWNCPRAYLECHDDAWKITLIRRYG